MYKSVSLVCMVPHFLPSKIQCVAVATFTIYIIVFMLFPSLLCHSRIPPSVEYRYIGQTNAEVCQYPDLSDPALADEPCQLKCCPMLHRAYTEAVQTYYRHSMH